MANRASVNVLRALHCSETGTCFQPACVYDRPPDDPRDKVRSILGMETWTTSREAECR